MLYAYFRCENLHQPGKARMRDSNLGMGETAVRLTDLTASAHERREWTGRLSESRIHVAGQTALQAGAAVRLETDDDIFLAEVVGVVGEDEGETILLDIQHRLRKAAIEGLVSRLRGTAPQSQASGVTAGV
jgi:hypothetical protein